eukprot:gene28105-11482_t
MPCAVGGELPNSPALSPLSGELGELLLLLPFPLLLVEVRRGLVLQLQLAARVDGATMRERNETGRAFLPGGTFAPRLVPATLLPRVQLFLVFSF